VGKILAEIKACDNLVGARSYLVAQNRNFRGEKLSALRAVRWDPQLFCSNCSTNPHFRKEKHKFMGNIKFGASFLACTVIWSASIASAQDANLIGYWRFDEADGIIAADDINNRNGVWQNVDAGMNPTNLEWVTDGGMRDGAARLADIGGNAINNFFTVMGDTPDDSLPELVNTEAFTISVWINPDVNTTQGGIFVTREAGGPFGIALEGPNPYHIDARAPSPTTPDVDTIFPAGPNGEEPGPWYHVALVWESQFLINGIPAARLYVDGQLVGMNTQNVLNTPFGFPDPDEQNSFVSGSWDIGNDRCCGGGRDYSGFIDDLTLWTVALTEPDIVRLAAGDSPLTLDTVNSDDDPFPDSYELSFATSPFPDCFDINRDDTDGDCDGDGVRNIDEFINGTNPTVADGDNDGLDDGRESSLGTNPSDPDTDNDGLLDGFEVNGGSMMVEVGGEMVVVTIDSDFPLDPTVGDTDGDLFTDLEELVIGTDPDDESGVRTPASTVLEPAGLIGHWTFDDAEGETTAVDSIGGLDAVWQNTGDPTGLRFGEPGQIGGAAALRGNLNDFFFVDGDPLQVYDFMADPVTGQLAREFTLSAWIRRDTTGIQGVFLARKNADLVLTVEGSRQSHWGMSITMSDGTTISDYRYAGMNIQSSVDTPIPLDEWTHLAMTLSITEEMVEGALVITGERRAFLNGVPVNDEPSDQPGLDEYRTQRSWYFGNDICCGGREFDGAIDDFAIFGRAMTPEEIMTLYTNGIGNETESTNAAGVVTPRLSDDPGSSSFMVTSIEPTGDGGYVLTCMC